MVYGLASRLEVCVFDAHGRRSPQQPTETFRDRLDDHDLLPAARTRLSPNAIGRRHVFGRYSRRPRPHDGIGNSLRGCEPQPGDALSLGAVHLFEVELVTAQIDDSRDAVQQWLGRCDITALK